MHTRRDARPTASVGEQIFIYSPHMMTVAKWETKSCRRVLYMISSSMVLFRALYLPHISRENKPSRLWTMTYFTPKNVLISVFDSFLLLSCGFFESKRKKRDGRYEQYKEPGRVLRVFSFFLSSEDMCQFLYFDYFPSSGNLKHLEIENTNKIREGL